METSNKHISLTAGYVRSKATVTQINSGTVTAFRDDDGEVVSTVYPLFEGVTLVDKQISRQEFISPWRFGSIPIFAIEHCREGQLEIRFGEEELILKPGDICLSGTDSQHK